MFKQITFIVTFLMMVSSLSAQVSSSQPSSRPASQPSSQPTSQASAKAPVMTFDKMFIDLGDVKRGEVREFTFPFVNTGNTSLKIDLVSSCDCTTTEYPTKEVQAGEKGEIQVVFDSTEKEESEVIDIDIFLREEDPVTGAPIIVMLQYTYNLITD